MLSDSKYLQQRINTFAKKQVGFMANPFLVGEDKQFMEQDEEGSDAERTKEERVQKQKMEEGGFTVIE